jgi:two-component system cell cycle response regulator
MNQHRPSSDLSAEVGRPETNGELLARTATPILGVPVMAGKRLLVVEDDPGLAETLSSMLGEQGYEVETVARGSDAVARAHEQPPALLLLDVGLPDQDGLEVALRLGGDRRTAHIPVLFLSGQEDLATRVRICRHLSCDFLRKPFGEAELLARIERSITDADQRARLRWDARIDELTGLGNARLLEERLHVEAARRARYGTPLTLVVMDLDRLKKINDEHGHLAGSAVIKALGHAIRAEIRETDVAFRFGGDEFVVLLPHTGLHEGMTFSERLLRRVRGLRPDGIPISVSMGVAAFDPSVDASVEAQLARADAATYKAKRMGGDSLVAADSVPAKSA